MSTLIESEMNDLLKRQLAPRDIALEMLDRLRDRGLQQEDKHAILQFAIQSGAHKESFNAMIYIMKSAQTIPWAQFMQLLQLHKIKVPEEVVDLILHVVKTKKEETFFFKSKAWDEAHPKIKNQRTRFFDSLKSQLMKIRQQLMDKVLFLRSQRMIEQEREVIDELIRMFPDDPRLELEQHSLKERWARHILSRHSADAYDLQRVEQRSEELDEETSQVATVIQNTLLDFQSLYPSASVNFAVSLEIMELHDGALEILEKAQPSFSRDWLYAEILLRTRRYIQCLETLDRLEERYADDPETTFAACYLRSRALWALGHRDQAIDLLKSIVKVRPDYRSAISVLNQWREERV